MEIRRLGRTGHQSSVAILGGAAFARSNPDETRAGFEYALAHGVNHLDIAPQYGEAQRLVGPLIPPVRDRLFVACKTLRKQPDGVRAQLEESLELLGCDQFDLYQLHAVTDLDELDRRADAAATILRARDEGLTRFVGVTGHELTAPSAHLEALRRYDLDTVMFPLNPRLWSDHDYRRDAEALLAECAARDVGVQIIKAAAARPWEGPSVDDRSRRHATTWYEPYTSGEEVGRGVRFVLSVPGVHSFCTPGDVHVLRTAIEAAERFEPIDLDEAAGEARSEPLIFPMPRPQAAGHP
jgi:aryl-alcohol dehydrogenase-like predicted oxidoreductase